MKNSVTKATGIKAYALVTQQAAGAIGLPDFLQARSVTSNTATISATPSASSTTLRRCSRNGAPRAASSSNANEPLAFESMEVDLPVPPAVAWAYLTDVDKKIRWQQGLDGMTMTGLVGGRVVPGAVQHCAHGKGSTVHEIVDWRPFDYVTWHIGTPMGTVARQTAEFTPLGNGGTHLSLRSAKVESGNAFAQSVVRLMMPVAAKKIVREQRASKLALERLVAEELAAATVADGETAA